MIPKHVIFLLLYSLQMAYPLVDTKDSGECVRKQNTTNCCANYAYNASVKDCVECVGSFGHNCSEECPGGFYGRSCNSKCRCSNDTCNKISGCLEHRPSEKDGICYDKENDTYCCANYMYLKNEHRCKECVGRFGINCSHKCPEGYYGKRCIEKCTCNASQCDDILGCLGPSSEFGRDGQSVSLSTKIVLPASLAAGTLLLCITIGCLCRFLKKKHTAEIQTNHANTTNMGQDEDSACIYAAVNRPKKKRVNGMSQHDTTYGNASILKESQHEGTDVRIDMSVSQEKHMVEDLDTEYSMCLEVEEMYDDTVCMTLSQSVERIHSSEIESFSI